LKTANAVPDSKPDLQSDPPHRTGEFQTFPRPGEVTTPANDEVAIAAPTIDAVRFWLRLVRAS